MGTINHSECNRLEDAELEGVCHTYLGFIADGPAPRIRCVWLRRALHKVLRQETHVAHVTVHVGRELPSEY